MKKRTILSAILAVIVVVCLAAGCGAQAPAESQAPVETEAATEAAAPEVVSVAEISYTNINYDFVEQIKADMEKLSLVPQAAEIGLTVSVPVGFDGLVLVPSMEEGNTSDYYLNVFYAGDVTFEGAIKSVSDSLHGDVAVEGGKALVSLAAIKDNTDQVITFTMEDGAVYNVHTIHQLLPKFEVTGSGVPENLYGTYDMSIDQFAITVNTLGEIIFYRDFSVVGEAMAENYQTQVTKEGTFHTIFIELHPEWRNANGGYSSGFYLVMDDNYAEMDRAMLVPNTDPNHTHGQGYLDQHEFVVLGRNHYLNLSYTPEYVENIPESCGATKGWVWAGVFQEVLNDQVVAEINTTDYPLLYESAVEKLDYAGSTDQGVTVTVGQNEVQSWADGLQDYVHPNSLDYTLNADGSVNKLLVSMRDQCAVYQFDMKSGAMEWILGGKASTLSGYDEYVTDRVDEAKNPFKALTYAQHYARYTNKNAEGAIEGNPIVSIFDNQTGDAPFQINPPAPVMAPNLTRVFKATIDAAAKTATVSDVINGLDLNKLTPKYHISSH
ncbi:MAG: aryl-sulfate sulfotransferase, partial [Parasporobacterium sp.]|nr:aryl-sulfate sulfotransferase [Parasporobacterium sp.]